MEGVLVKRRTTIAAPFEVYMETRTDSTPEIPSLIPNCPDLEGALDDVLRPLRAAARIFWIFNQKPENEEQQTIIDLCLMMEEAVCQVQYLIEHAKIDGKPVACASVEYHCARKVL